MDLDLGSLLNPRSVAIIGASARTSGHAGRALANLERTGYPGEIYPINPKYEAIGARRCYPSIRDVEAAVDAAYILLPADRVAAALEECGAHGVRTAIVCTSGFGETGEAGQRAQRRLAELARTSGMRLLGPNCIGVLNLPDRYVGCPTFNITDEHIPGSVSILSHSGGIASILFNRAMDRGIGIRAVVSLGNEADIQLGELVDAFVDDPQTRVLALFVEQLRDGPRFVAAAGRARAAGKPIVVLKAGRSAAGSRTVFGHTGALAGEHAVFRGVMRQLGVVEAGGMDELLATAALLAAAPAPRGGRLGVLSPSGGESGYVADLADDRGLELPELSPQTAAPLAELLRFGTPGNPLDPTGAIIGDPALLRRVLATFTAEPRFDMIAFAIPAWGRPDAEALLPAFVDAAAAAGKPAVISMWRAGRLTERADEILRAAPVPTYPSADEAIAALGNLHRYWSAAAVDNPPAPRSISPPAGPLSEPAAKRLLASAGLPVVRESFVASAEEVPDAGAGVDGPAVVKLIATGVVHKAALGLVRTGVTGRAALAEVAAALRETARSRSLAVEGYLVAQQVDGVEIIVGGVRDPAFGPVVMVGAGGVLAERFSDTTFRRCPISPGEAARAVRELGIHPMLAGHDIEALGVVVSEFSRIFAGSPGLAEVDLNPVIVHPGSAGCTIVDAAIQLTGG